MRRNPPLSLSFPPNDPVASPRESVMFLRSAGSGPISNALVSRRRRMTLGRLGLHPTAYGVGGRGGVGGWGGGGGGVGGGVGGGGGGGGVGCWGGGGGGGGGGAPDRHPGTSGTPGICRCSKHGGLILLNLGAPRLDLGGAFYALAGKGRQGLQEGVDSWGYDSDRA